MKLTDEMKKKIDSFFDKISSKELYKIAIEKYGLVVSRRYKMKYKSKPIIVDAIQFNRNNITEVALFTNYTSIVSIAKKVDGGKAQCTIPNIRGSEDVICNEGDWIVKDSHGHSVVTDKVFKATYEEFNG